MNLVKQKFKYHIQGWKSVLSFFFIVSFLPLGYEHITQYIFPRSNYYVYDFEKPVELIKTKSGESIILQSNVSYLKPINMKWFDTLVCDGIKYKTQIWEDYKQPGIYFTKWEYSDYITTGEEENCKICGFVLGTTNRGYEKTFKYCTKNFNTKD